MAVTIRELRDLTGLSQAKFGTKYNIPIRTIQDWEAGVRTPPKYLIELLERVVKEDMKKEAE